MHMFCTCSSWLSVSSSSVAVDVFKTTVGALSSFFLPRRHRIRCTMMLIVELCTLMEERERERERAGVAGLILTAAAHWRPSCQWISGYGESSLQPWRNQFTRPLHDDMYQTTSASIIVPRCLSICVLVSFFVKQPAVVQNLYGTKVCRYNWHSAGSLG